MPGFVDKTFWTFTCHGCGDREDSESRQRCPSCGEDFCGGCFPGGRDENDERVCGGCAS